jgi:hypothetical protein
LIAVVEAATDGSVVVVVVGGGVLEELQAASPRAIVKAAQMAMARWGGRLVGTWRVYGCHLVFVFSSDGVRIATGPSRRVGDRRYAAVQ